MIIGIDIDNTLTDVKKDINDAAFNYARQLGKDVSAINNLDEDINNNSLYYIKKFHYNYDELKQFLSTLWEDIVSRAKPRENVVDVIDELKKEGNKIYIVTSRVKEFHKDPYLLSKNWLDKNNISYDKLIVDIRDKSFVCKREKIDIFIDDQLSNCIQISNSNTKVIRITNDKINYENIINCENWVAIYDVIKGMK